MIYLIILVGASRLSCNYPDHKFVILVNYNEESFIRKLQRTIAVKHRLETNLITAEIIASISVAFRTKAHGFCNYINSPKAM